MNPPVVIDAAELLSARRAYGANDSSASSQFQYLQFSAVLPRLEFLRSKQAATAAGELEVRDLSVAGQLVDSSE
jgi:hypothetical protein